MDRETSWEQYVIVHLSIDLDLNKIWTIKKIKMNNIHLNLN
jgi:hypothetical protein